MWTMKSQLGDVVCACHEETCWPSINCRALSWKYVTLPPHCSRKRPGTVYRSARSRQSTGESGAARCGTPLKRRRHRQGLIAEEAKISRMTAVGWLGRIRSSSSKTLGQIRYWSAKTRNFFSNGEQTAQVVWDGRLRHRCCPVWTASSSAPSACNVRSSRAQHL
jgi:hypothetical protein